MEEFTKDQKVRPYGMECMHICIVIIEAVFELGGGNWGQLLPWGDSGQPLS